MLLALDVHYRKDLAKVVGFVFNWLDSEPKEIFFDYINDVEKYIPGQFYKRELPCLLKIIEKLDLTIFNAIIVDGHIYVDNNFEFGLGGKLYESLERKIPIIGVAKTEFFKNKQTVKELYRGESKTLVDIHSHEELLVFINKLESPSELKFQFPITIIAIGSAPKEIKTEREYLGFLKNLVPIFNPSNYESRFIWFKLGDHTKYPQNSEDNKKLWSIGFQKFDIDFHHGKVIHSSLHAALKIEKFKKLEDNGHVSEDTLYVDIIGEWENSENFMLLVKIKF